MRIHLAHHLLTASVLLSACAPHLSGPPTDTLAQAGLDRRYWDAALQEVLAKGWRIDSVVVNVHGQTVAEAYLNSTTAETPHDLRSVTKSITSLLLGIALDRRLIASVDTPVADFFPDYPTPASWREHRPITLRDLLTMSSGLDCDDWRPSAGNEEGMYPSADWLAYFFRVPAIHEPGTVFGYCTAGVVVLGEVISRAANMPLPQFAQQALFGPLGIQGATWASAPRGVTDGGGHLRLTPRDLLKIGLLLRQDGVWNGQPLVSAAWLRDSQAPRFKVVQGGPNPPQYGYLWWLAVQGSTVRSTQAWGTGGQYMMRVPDPDLTVVFTGSAWDGVNQMAPFEVMNRFIVPMAQGKPFPGTP